MRRLTPDPGRAGETDPGPEERDILLPRGDGKAPPSRIEGAQRADRPPTALEIALHLARRGAGPWVRGLLVRLRLGACGGRLFVGRGTRFYFARQVFLGRGVVIGERCVLKGLSRRGIRLGNGVHLQDGVRLQATSVLSDIGEGMEIGAGTYVGPGCTLGAGGGITIGRRCLLGGSVDLLAENHRFDDPGRPIRDQGVTRRGIEIGDDVWIGNKTVILDGVRVGEGAVIGAGSVVTRDVPPSAVVAGNPARILRFRTASEDCRGVAPSA